MELEKLFVLVLNNSITASWVVLAVCALRLLLRRCPRRFICLLWLLPAFRLIFPFSVESALSLIPSAKTVPVAILTAKAPAIDSNIAFIDGFVNNTVLRAAAPRVQDSANPMQVIMFAAGVVWLIGVCALLIYMLISSLRLRARLRDAVFAAPGIWMSDSVASPFVMGVFSPRIILPCSIDDKTAGFVLAHERTHLRRRDNILKPCAFLLAAVYWFAPAVWLAYYLFSRDIELACDEAVVVDFDLDRRKAYSGALLYCAVHNSALLSPLAFGESSVKERIKNVLNFKKPTVIISAVALIVCAVAALSLLTDPLSQNTAPPDISGKPVGSTSAPADMSRFAPVQTDALSAWDPHYTLRDESKRAEYEAAAKSAQTELDKLHELGIMSNSFVLNFEHLDQSVYEDPGYQTNDVGRTLGKGYTFSCRSVEEDAYFNFYISEDTGKIYRMTSEFSHGEGDPVLDREPLDMGTGSIAYYDCFYRAMSEDMTIDRLCTLLCKYWGFTGYTLSGTKDPFYGYDTEAPAGNTLVKDIIDKPYITVYFDGDQEGVPMYLELINFPGRICFIFGTGHLVG